MAADHGEDAGGEGMTKFKTDLQGQAALMDMASKRVPISYGPTDMGPEGVTCIVCSHYHGLSEVHKTWDVLRKH